MAEDNEQVNTQDTTPPVDDKPENIEENQEPPKSDDKKDEPPKENKEDEEEEKQNTPKDDKEVKDVLTQNGLDYAALESEYMANNGFTEETLNKLHKAGFSDEFIEAFVEGKKAIAERELNELAEVIGGREVYDNVIQFAASNLTPEVIQSINDVRDKNILKLILPTLKEQMEAKEGKPPSQPIQGKGQAIPENIFESKHQMMEAIRDKRYLQDPAYAAKVTAKIRASREAGIDLGI